MGAKKIEDFPTILYITVDTDKYCSTAGGLQAFVLSAREGITAANITSYAIGADNNASFSVCNIPHVGLALLVGVCRNILKRAGARMQGGLCAMRPRVCVKVSRPMFLVKVYP